MPIYEAANLAGAALNGAIDAVQTTLKYRLATTGPFAFPTTYPYIIWIDKEAIEVTADDGGIGDARIYTVTRGFEGTTAAAHIDESQVELRFSKAYYDGLVAAISAGGGALNYQAVGFGDATNVLTGTVDDLWWDEANKFLGINVPFTLFGVYPRERVDIFGNLLLEPVYTAADSLSHASYKVVWSGITRARVPNPFPPPNSFTQPVETNFSAYISPFNPDTSIREDIINWFLHDDRENVDLIRANVNSIDIFPSVTTAGYFGLKVNNSLYVTAGATVANTITVSDDLDASTQSYSVYTPGTGQTLIFQYASESIDYVQIADVLGTPKNFHNFATFFTVNDPESALISAQTGLGGVRWYVNDAGMQRMIQTGGLSWSDGITSSARPGEFGATLELQFDRLDANTLRVHDGAGNLRDLRLRLADLDTFRLNTTPTAGYVLTSDAFGNGTWQPATGGGSGITSLNGLTGATQTFTNDTNVTITSGGTAHVLGWTGSLGVSRGGTGTSTAFTPGSLIFAGAAGVYNQDNAQLFWDDTNNRLGIGTNTPDEGIRVKNKTIVVTGGIGVPNNIPFVDSGAAIVWNPSKGALRAGLQFGTGSFDDANVGYATFGAGEDCVASGSGSVAMGSLAQATGNWSVSLGDTTLASGPTGSVALGSQTTASGDFGSTAIGYQSLATGDASISLGYLNDASGLESLALGSYNTASNANSIAVGYSNTVTGNGSIAVGAGSSVTAGFSYGSVNIVDGYAYIYGSSNTSTATAVASYIYGTRIKANAAGTITIGRGNAGIGGELEVTTPQAIGIGSNSNLPTIYISPAGGIGNTGNVGIGNSSPAQKLDVTGTVQMTGFKLTTTPTLGYVLTSDATGVGTWQVAPSGGLTDSNFVDNEVPGGTIDGVNDTFTLANTPTAGTEHLYKNGIRQRVGGANDYTISGATITFNAGNIPLTGHTLLVDYRKP